MSSSRSKNPDKPPTRDRYSKLLEYLKCKKPEKFAKFMNSYDIDADHEYGSPDNGTLLDIACRTGGNAKFVESLIQHGARINSINKTFGKAPIHDVVQNDDVDTLRILLQSGKCDPHIQDKYGNCVLHYVAVRKNIPIARILKQHLDPDIVAWKLVDRALVDLVNYHTSDQIKNEVRCLLENNTTKKLFALLYNRQSDQFIERIQQLEAGMGRDFLYDNDGYNTYMQYACKAGLVNVVDTLLRMQIDPNNYCYRNPMNPIMISAFQGFHRILKILLDHADISFKPIGQHNVLHCLFYGMYMNRNVVPVDDEPIDYLVCLEYLYKKAIQSNKIDVNSADEKNYTALHYAVQLNEKYAIRLLIDAGADVCQKNCNGQTPLSLINPSTLEEYLDSCISINNVHCGDKNHNVIFRYNIFTPRTKKSCGKKPYTSERDLNQKNEIRDHVSEIGPLVTMTKTAELRGLLKHPVIMSFVTLKWHVVKKFFFINAAFYLLFAISMSLWCLAYSSSLRNDSINSSATSITTTTKNPTNNSNPTRRTPIKALEEALTILNEAKIIPGSEEYLTHAKYCVNKSLLQLQESWNAKNRLSDPILLALLILVGIFYILLCLRESFQISIHPRYYVKSLENWLIMGIIISTGITLAASRSSNCDYRRLTASITVFFIWLEFVILLGRYPPLSTNQEMFKRFSCSFFKFTHWFSLLIFAFLISIYIKYNNVHDNYHDLFIDPFESIFLLFVKNNGQINHFKPRAAVPEAIYLAVVLFIAIVLFNLLNGLAVTDTQKVKSEAELLHIIARVNFISHLETIAFSVPDCYRRFFNKLSCTKTGRSYVERFYRGLHLFPYIFADRSVHVSPNMGNQVLYVTTEENSPEGPYMVLSRWRIDSKTVKNAMKIYEKQLERDDRDLRYDQIIAELSQQTHMYQTRIDAMDTRNDKMEKQIDRLIEENIQTQAMLKEVLDWLKPKS